MTPEERRIRGNDAHALLDNSLFKQAFSAVDAYLDRQALACPPDDGVMAQRIILSKQLLASIRREVERVVQDGEIASVQMTELERKRGLARFMRR